MFKLFRPRSATSVPDVQTQNDDYASIPKPKPDLKKPYTFRLSVIPSSVDEKKLRQCLDSLSYTKKHYKNILALSLVKRSSWQVATATFHEVPSEFRECSRNCPIEVELDVEGIKNEITVDVDFYGVSPLYSPPQEQATVE
jgi:hypothetical protein